MRQTLKSTDPVVAVVCLSPHPGGMELDALRMALRIQSAFSCVFVCRLGTFIHEQAQSAALEVITVSGSSWLANKAISPRLIFDLRALFRSRTISDVIFFGTSEIRSIAIASIGLQIRLHLRHGTTVSRSKFGWWREFGYRRVDTYLANSEHIAKNIVRFFPRSATAKVRVVYPVVQFPEAMSADQSVDHRVIQIVYHSRFVEGKGHIDAILACQYLRDRKVNFRFEMIGDLSDLNYVERLRKLIADSGLANFCSLLPFNNDVFQKLAAADIFLGPSHGEGFSNSFTEALSLGLVCVTYDNTVYPECAELGFYFLMALDRDTDDLSKKIYAAVENMELHKQQAQKNMSLARSLFSAERELADLTTILRPYSSD